MQTTVNVKKQRNAEPAIYQWSFYVQFCFVPSKMLSNQSSDICLQESVASTRPPLPEKDWLKHRLSGNKKL